MKYYHLKPGDEEWVLTLDGDKRPLASFDSKMIAVSLARALAMQRGGGLKVFRRDGSVEEVRRPPEGMGARRKRA